MGRLIQQGVLSGGKPEEQKKGFFSKALSVGKDLAVGTIKSNLQTFLRTKTDPLNPQSNLIFRATPKPILDKVVPKEVNLPILGQTSIRYSDKLGSGIGQRFEDALNIGTAYVGGGVAGSVAKQGVKEVAKQTVKQSGKQIAKTALADFTVGGGYGAASELQKPGGTTAKDVAKATLIGGSAAVAIPRVLGGTLKLGGRVFGAVGSKIASGADSLAGGLEKFAEPKAAALGERFYQAVDKPVNSKLQQVASSGAGIIRSVQKFPSFLAKGFLDKFNPVKQFQEKARAAGIDTLDLQDMAQATGYRASGRAENKLDDYLAMRQSYEPVWSKTKEMAHYLDDLDRVERGNAIAGGRTKEQVQEDLQKLIQSMTPEEQTKVKQAHSDLQKFLDQELQGAVDSGRISKEQFTQIKQAHPNYIPHDVLDFLDEDQLAQQGARSFNVSKSGIQKAEGSVREIDDIDNAITRRIFRNSLLSEKNKTMAAIVETGRQMGFKPLRTAENVAERQAIYKELSLLRGERDRIAESVKITSSTDKDILRKFNELDTQVKDLESKAKDIAKWNDEDLLTLTPSKAEQLNVRAQKQETKMQNLEGEKQRTEAMLDQLLSTMKEKKQQMQKMYESSLEYRDIQMKKVDITKQGFEKVSYFKNGVREDWLVPADLGKALKGMDGEGASKVLSWINNSAFGKTLTAPARAIRKLATGVEATFAIVRNPLRDIQTVMVTSKALPQDYAKGLATVIAGKGKKGDDLYRLARESGALQGSVFREFDAPEQILQRKLSKGGVFSKVARPDKLIENAGQAMEEMTRIAVFSRAMKDGKSAQEAAKMARNATVDFGKSGNIMQVINKFIPFLNARVQGFSNLATRLKDDPTKFVRAGMYSAAIPAAMLNGHNSRFESYKNIPSYEKDKYWVVMVGEVPGKDYSGKPIKIPNYLRIPKGEAQQAIASSVDRVLDIGKQKHPESTNEFLVRLIGNTSPIQESSIFPAGFQQAVELKANYSFFKEKQIEPDYIKTGSKFSPREAVPAEARVLPNTSETAKVLGEALGWSPIKIDYVLKTGALNDILRGIDIPARGFTGNTTFEKAAELPLLRSFIGASTAGAYEDKKRGEQREAEKKAQSLIDKAKKKTTTTPSGGGRIFK